VPLAMRIHEGIVWSNRDQRTLLDKMLALIGTFPRYLPMTDWIDCRLADASSPPPHSNKTRKNAMTNDNAWREINFTETEQTLQEAEEQLFQELTESVPRQFGKTDEPACPPKRHITSVAKNFVRPTIRERLERGFGPEAGFYVAEGNPIAIWPDWDYAEDWSAYPIREVHPFHPVLHGKKITEAEFRTLVKAMHNLS
jgi:hypothetical protein